MFDLDTFLPYRLIRAGQAASEAVAGRYASEFGLSVPQWRVLAHLSRRPKISVNELCKLAGLDRVSTSRACTALEGNNWIKKVQHPSDKRLLIIDLTAEGRSRFEVLSAVALDAEKRLLNGVTPSEIGELYSVLAKIEENSSKDGCEDAKFK